MIIQEVTVIKTKKNLSEVAYDQIKDLIMVGKVSQRERILEVQLAEQLNISRTPIREAVRMLEKDGLVSRDSMGAYITPLSKKEAQDLYKVRIELEELSVKEAMENGTDEEFQELKDIIEALKHMSGDEETSTIIQVNTAFHSHLSKMSGNFYLQHTLRDIRTRLSLIRVSSLIAKRRYDVSLREHIAVGEAMLDGKKENAAKLIRAHAEQAAAFAMYNIYE
ncbi:GntR family transcriptional regulator [Salisediminibacterium beveridgei]|uniref:Putative HTH-type transcriptional regulator ydhC n=1 Tax=Salisediminibacterium beveridgei TaxID=632773 RepID=A0A1D7QS71_9BACI|nr:GntR family transcriptional regulator [Salisediminibacterium beveridgei]AOM81841.1 putative HTH-type transcriptional regulator ydhC [Salisediminibacterium beveridgei]